MAWTNGAKVGVGGGGTVSTVLFSIPAGPCTVLISNIGTASPAYIGMGTAVTATNGFPVPSGAVSPVVLTGYQGSAGAQLSATCSSGSASLAWIISTATGGTGF